MPALTSTTTRSTPVTITIPEGRAPLYRRFPGQPQPQGAYLELDTEAGTARWDYTGELGNAVPVRVWHNIVRRVPVSPNVSAQALRELSDEITPLVGRVLAGSDTRWTGSNHVGTLTDDAQDALAALEARLAAIELGGPETVEVWEADEWTGDSTDAQLGISAETTDDEITALATQYVGEAEVEIADGVHGMTRVLTARRDAIRAN